MQNGGVKERTVRKSLSLKKSKNKEGGCGQNGISADISKYFTKKKTGDELKDDHTVASVRDKESQPSAKRQRNNKTFQENEATTAADVHIVATLNKNKCSDSFVDLVLDSPRVNCDSFIRNQTSSDQYTSIKNSYQFTNNSSDFEPRNKCSSTSQPQGQLSTSSFRSSTTLSSPSMDQDDLIPPTPSPVDSSKSANKFSTHFNKNEGTRHTDCLSKKPQRNYKVIKRPSISSNKRFGLHDTAQPYVTSNVSESVKENCAANTGDCKQDENLRCFSGMGQGKSVEVPCVKSATSSMRKTFKLSTKGKKAVAGRSLNKKLEHSGCQRDDGDIDERSEEHMLLGYGCVLQRNGVCMTKKDQDIAGMDHFGEKNPQGQVKTRRKLYLDKTSELGNAEIQEKETERKIHDVNLDKSVSTQDKISFLEEVSKEDTVSNCQDMFDLSLSNDEFSQWMQDNISWSPMEKKTSTRKPAVVTVSPAKQYVRSRSVELNSLAGSISFQETLKRSPQNADTSTQGYRRFLVLEVYRREILDSVSAMNNGIEKVLRLFDESDNSEKYCQLRGEWERTEVEHGDIVNVIGEQSSSGSYILENDVENYIIVSPDILVTPTSISSSTKCLRRSILDKYFKTEGPSEVMFLGTLLHRIFEAALTSKDFSAKFVLNHAAHLLRQPSNLTELYGLGITEDDVLSKVSEFTTFLSEWGQRFFNAEPHPTHSVIDFKEGGRSKNEGDSQVALCVSQVLDIEECVWSPKFGLKGQIDSSVEVKINRNPNIMRKKPALNETCVLPLELKTGKVYTKLGSVEHRAQVILYSLMISERYSQTLDTGLLLYLKTGHMLGVPAYTHEKRALVMKRNELVRYLAHSGTRLSQNMPGMIQDERSCKYCPQLNVCTLYHKSVERGDSQSAGMGNIFEKTTSHLSPVHLKYFSHWNHLIALESKAMQEKGNASDIWCLSGVEREQLGYCFSKMSLVSCSASEEPGRYLNIFEKQEVKSSSRGSADMHLVKGDYVVASQEDGIMALATGFLAEISEDAISVLLDKDLTKSYHHRNFTPDQHPLYRIDKAEISTGATIQWSNLAKLFSADSEESAKLRRLIVDLESPRFSRANAVVSGLPSSQVSTTWSSQLSSCSMTSPVKSSQGSNSELTQILQDLNSDQRKAIGKVLAAQDYALILGCPGAGKTHTIACLVRALISLGKSVLLTSYTHSAVDNILLKLTQHQVDFLRLGSVQKVHAEIQPYVVSNAAKHINTMKELRDFYESKLVVATTCLGVNHTIFNQRSFDYCIVDEASQITQPVCIGSLRHASIFVLVGDHYQLPPLVQSHKARDEGMDISLFKRLSEHHPLAVVHLEYQYRMHKDIMLLSNTLIYENRLKCATREISEALLDLPRLRVLREDVAMMEQQRQGQLIWLLEVLDPQFPVLFLNTDLLPAPEVRSGHNVCNEIEAALIATVTQGLIKSGLRAEDIGVISPYRQQLKVIKQHLSVGDEEERNSSHHVEVEINTIDKYQGRDKLCVIVSLVRSNASGHVGDLLRDWRRVNVALTRAKRKLILLGSRQSLNHNLLFQELLALLEKKSWIYTLPSSAWRGLLPW